MFDSSPVLNFKNKKTFLQALGFYLAHLIFIFFVTFIFEMIFLGFLPEGYIDKSLVMIPKILSTTYLIIIAILLIKNKAPENKIPYFNLMLLGGLSSYLLTPPLGYLFLAYITTLGKGWAETATIFI